MGKLWMKLRAELQQENPNPDNDKNNKTLSEMIDYHRNNGTSKYEI